MTAASEFDREDDYFECRRKVRQLSDAFSISALAAFGTLAPELVNVQHSENGGAGCWSIVPTSCCVYRSLSGYRQPKSLVKLLAERIGRGTDRGVEESAVVEI